MPTHRKNSGSPPRPPKNLVLTEAGRSPWYRADGTTVDTYIIGIAGGSASGKTRVAQAILKQLGVPWVAVVSQDSYYKPLSAAQSVKAFKNEHDFDCPDAFDYELLREALSDLRKSRAVQVPTYSFAKHNRTGETTYLYGATVVIVEGIFALHDPDIRDLLDLKVFVQCDSDLMLARRLRRDLVERGRDAEGVLDQYLRFVKPSFDAFVQPTAKYADVIVRGSENETAVSLIASHIRRQLDDRKADLRKELFHDVAQSVEESHSGTSVATSTPVSSNGARRELPPSVFVMPGGAQLHGIHTVLRDRTTSQTDFRFFADRLSTLVVEHALTRLPFHTRAITTRTQLPYDGQALDIEPGHLCGVSILRSGASLEKGLRRVLRDVPLGSMLVQSDVDSGEPLLYDISLPVCLTASAESAAKSWVLLLDSQIGTGAAALMGVRTLLDHGVPEDHIVICCILVSRIGGVWALRKAFPKVQVVTSAVDDHLEERWVWPHEEETWTKDAVAKRKPTPRDVKPKKIFAILPGLGSFGDRYYGS